MTRGNDFLPSVGRYSVHGKIASGGMATIFLGRLRGPVGFAKPVAMKRLRPDVATDPAVVTMLVDEARIASRVRHANVVPILDVLTEGGEVWLVMEYVHGESLACLLRSSSEPPPAAVACSIVCGMLHGLHAAHEALGRNGEPLGIIHRDVSPQNMLVGDDGIARVIDFGVAKARGRLQATLVGQIKGKPAYMAPEQWTTSELTRHVDVYAAGLVLYEALTLERVKSPASPPSQPDPKALPASIPTGLRDVIAKALAPTPGLRFSSAREMALAIEATTTLATPTTVAEWVKGTASARLAERESLIAELDEYTAGTMRVDAPKTDGVVPLEPTRAPETSRPTSSRERRPRRAWVWLLPAPAVLLVGAGYAMTRCLEESLPSTAAREVASAPAPATRSASSLAPPSVVPPSAPPPAQPSAPPPIRTAQRRPQPSVPDCNPPYIVDDSGRHVYKRHCFH